MSCYNCGRSVPMLKPHPTIPDVGLCGICEINLHKQAPSVVGVTHANEVDPANPDPQQALEQTLHDLQQSPDDRNRLTNREAEFIQKVHKRDFDRVKGEMHNTPDRLISMQRERIQQMTMDDIGQIDREKRAIAQKLAELQPVFAEKRRRAGKGAPNTVTDIP